MTKREKKEAFFKNAPKKEDDELHYLKFWASYQNKRIIGFTNKIAKSDKQLDSLFDRLQSAKDNKKKSTIIDEIKAVKQNIDTFEEKLSYYKNKLQKSVEEIDRVKNENNN